MENYNLIKDSKQKLFKIVDRIEFLKKQTLTTEIYLELRHLEVLKMNAYSEWKD